MFAFITYTSVSWSIESDTRNFFPLCFYCCVFVGNRTSISPISKYMPCITIYLVKHF